MSSGSMHLYSFGVNATSTRNPVLQARHIKILWSSWCDSLIAQQDLADSWSISYSGESLTAAQENYMNKSEELKRALNDDTLQVGFFGSTMHDGLRGYILSRADASSSSTHQEIVLFATDIETKQGISEVRSYSMQEDHHITSIIFLSNDNVLLTHTVHDSQSTFVEVPVLQLRDYLSPPTRSGPTDSSFTVLPLIQQQHVSNATTRTLLSSTGQVYTSTSDPRFPKCLGRPSTSKPSYELLPYLSETPIVKIASGGYMSAALSADGELFLWGQACPGSTGEIDVLQQGKGDENESEDEAQESLAGIRAEGEQDEHVKCMEVQIGGVEARVYDVAIGHGHVLVAAEADGGANRAVFAAGDNGRKQLALAADDDFVEEFREVTAFRGKRITQFMATGWSSLVVTAEESSTLKNIGVNGHP